MGNYADFEIWIGTPLPVLQVPWVGCAGLSSPTGPAQGSCARFEDGLFKQILQSPRDRPDLELRKSFGKRLFDAVFNAAVLNEWNRSLDTCKRVEPTACDCGEN